MPILTTDEARRYLPALSTGEAPTLAELVDAVDADAARFLGFPYNAAGARTLASSSYVEYLNGPRRRSAERGGSRVLSLKIRPVSAVSQVAQDLNWDWDGNVVDPGQYSLNGDRGEILSLPTGTTRWYSGHRAIRVQYTGGWSASGPDNRDPALVDALAFWVAHRFQQRHRGGKSKATTRGASADFRPEDMPARVRATLRGLRGPGAWP